MFSEKFNTPDGKGHFVPAEFRPPAELTFAPFYLAGTAANVLTNPAFDPTCKMPELKVSTIKIEKMENDK